MDSFTLLQKTQNTENKKSKPVRNVSRKSASKIKRKEPQPNYFKGIKLLLDDGLQTTHSELIRSFITCGGVVLTKKNINEVTHVLHLYGIIRRPNFNCPSSARHVVVDWVQDTLNKKHLQDYRPYTTRWDPDDDDSDHNDDGDNDDDE